MMPKIVGLTGGIGSGKTTIAKHFAIAGIPVYIADEEAKKILASTETAVKIGEAFGAGVVTDGVPDRKKLAALVFNDPEKLKKLNSIIHPAVAAHFGEWLKLQTGQPFVIREAAILFESGSYRDCYRIITVTAPVEVRIERVMSRDGVTKAQVQERMAHQWTDEQKIAMSHYVIENVVLASALQQADTIMMELKKL